jgi:hypothetical protein
LSGFLEGENGQEIVFGIDSNIENDLLEDDPDPLSSNLQSSLLPQKISLNIEGPNLHGSGSTTRKIKGDSLLPPLFPKFQLWRFSLYWRAGIPYSKASCESIFRHQEKIS